MLRLSLDLIPPWIWRSFSQSLYLWLLAAWYIPAHHYEGMTVRAIHLRLLGIGFRLELRTRSTHHAPP